MRFFGLVTLLAVFSTGALACSSPSGPEVGGTGASPVTSDGGVFGCDTDPRAETYAANMKKLGMSRTFQFEIVTSVPAPPIKGNNSWTLRVLDAAGNAVPGAMITSINPTMPDHGHGTSIVATATTNPDGTFAIAPLFLFMPGIWQIQIQASAGTTSDTVDFDFCIDG